MRRDRLIELMALAIVPIFFVAGCGGVEEVGCSNECSAIGLSECTNNEVRSCEADNNGCRAWSEFEACGAVGDTPGTCQDAESCFSCEAALDAGDLDGCDPNEPVEDTNECGSVNESGDGEAVAKARSCGEVTFDNGGQTYTCDAWGAYSECPVDRCFDGERCWDPAIDCSNECLAEGARVCNLLTGVISACLADESGCFVLGPGQGCPGLVCADTTSCAP